MKNEILKNFSGIKLFLFDLEGCLIPKNFVHNDKSEDDLIDKLRFYCNEFRSLNLELGIITASRSEIVNRLKSKNLCFILDGSINKLELANKIINEKKITYEEVFYLGDDLLDIPLLQKCKISACPFDGRREVKRVVTFVTKSKSGFVIEEILEYIKQSKK
ncbi:MAG: HAD hydrolase family protein [Melioribacteraceae bacterium]|nr:HAD hydrolase family protein [Melioribacteraceae bacterium]